VLAGQRAGLIRVAVAQRRQQRVVLAGGFGAGPGYLRDAMQGCPQQAHQRQQQRAPCVLVDSEVELAVQVRVGRVAVGEGSHAVVQRGQPGQAGLVDLAGRQRGAEGFEGGADLEVLLHRAVGRGRHGEAAVRVALEQALGFEAAHRLPDRRLADPEPPGQVTLAKLLPRGQLTGDDQLADKRDDQISLADVRVGHVSSAFV
jgi:hypothetical protein